MFGYARVTVAVLAMSAAPARAEKWIVFPVDGGAVAYNDNLLVNKENGAIQVTAGTYTRDLRYTKGWRHRYSFETWQVDCKAATMRPVKAELFVEAGNPESTALEFGENTAWTPPGHDPWANLVAQIACTDAQAPNAQEAPSRTTAMLTMSTVAAGPKP